MDWKVWQRLWKTPTVRKGNWGSWKVKGQKLLIRVLGISPLSQTYFINLSKQEKLTKSLNNKKDQWKRDNIDNLSQILNFIFKLKMNIYFFEV